MQVIEHIELASAQSSITFSSIDQSFTDLLIVGSARSNRAAVDDDCQLSFNGSSTNYTIRRLFGTGSGQASIATPAQFAGYLNGNSATASSFSSISLYIPNYAGSTAKSYSTDSVTENNATESYQDISAGLWNDTSAITSITFSSRRGENLLAGTSFTLYGITAGSDGTTAVS